MTNPNYIQLLAKQVAEILAEELPAKRVEFVTKKIVRAATAAIKVASVSAPPSPTQALAVLRELVAPPRARAPKAKAEAAAAPKPEAERVSKLKPKTEKVKDGKRDLSKDTKSAGAVKKHIYWALFRKAKGEAPRADDAEWIKQASPVLLKEYRAKIAVRLAAEAAAPSDGTKAVTSPAPDAPPPEAKIRRDKPVKIEAAPKARAKPKAKPEAKPEAKAKIRTRKKAGTVSETAPTPIPAAADKANGAETGAAGLPSDQRNALGL